MNNQKERTLARECIIKILYQYGGMVVPSSFICFKPLCPLYDKCIRTNKAFIVENNNFVYRLDTTPPLFYDVDAQQSDPSQSFSATDLIADDDLGYSSTDNITKNKLSRLVLSLINIKTI